MIKLLLLLSILTSCTTNKVEPNLHGLIEVKGEDGCERPQVKNFTGAWTNNDEVSLNSTYAGCVRRFGKESCPKVFIKTAEFSYRVVCGMK